MRLDHCLAVSSVDQVEDFKLMVECSGQESADAVESILPSIMASLPVPEAAQQP